MLCKPKIADSNPLPANDFRDQNNDQEDIKMISIIIHVCTLIISCK